jgi:hypothetical protein
MKNTKAVELQEYHILSSSGAPFQTEQAAKISLGQRKLPKSKFKVVELTDGRFAISPKKPPVNDAGLPDFKAVAKSEPKPEISKEDQEVEDLLKDYITAKNSDDIDGIKRVVNILSGMNVVFKEVEGGGIQWNRVRQTSPTQPIDIPELKDIKPEPPKLPNVVQKVKAKEDEPVKEKYYYVEFNARQSELETVDVALSVNGETLIFQRQRRIVIPARYKECADHATHIKYIQLPGQERKTAGTIKTYPYQEFGEATEEEYKAQLKTGTAKTQENIHLYGFQGAPPDTSAIQ